MIRILFKGSLKIIGGQYWLEKSLICCLIKLIGMYKSISLIFQFGHELKFFMNLLQKTGRTVSYDE